MNNKNMDTKGSKPIPKPRRISLLHNPSDMCQHHMIKMRYPLGWSHCDNKERMSVQTSTESNGNSKFSSDQESNQRDKSTSIDHSNCKYIMTDIRDHSDSVQCQELCVVAYNQENNQDKDICKDCGQCKKRAAISCDVTDSIGNHSESLNNTIRRISSIMNQRKKPLRKTCQFHLLSPPPGYSGSNVANHMRYLNTNVANACDPLDPMNEPAERHSGLLVEVESSEEDTVSRLKPAQFTKEACITNMSTDIMFQSVWQPIIDRAVENYDKREKISNVDQISRIRQYKQTMNSLEETRSGGEKAANIAEEQHQVIRRGYIENNLNKMDNKFSKNPYLTKIRNAVLNSQRGTIDIYIRGQEILMAGKGGYSLTRKMHESTLYTDLEAKDFRLHNVNPSDNSVKVMPAPENSVFQVQYEKDKFMF